MTLYDHAERELNMIQCEEPEKTALLEAVRGFAKGGWSGGSVGWGVATLVRLLEFKPLSPISSEPTEWNHIADERTPNGPIWQSQRRSTTFSRDGGRTWYDIEDPSQNNGDVWKRDEAEWEDVLLGTNIQVDDRVRVKYNAFADPRLGGIHNGREGELVAVDAGQCVVRYDDGHEFRFLPVKLEVLKTS